ncbi:hypothetical protein [Thioalkalivibrio thiocyanodenitrificans]|uniref:hypothetical protein n=1 Tax=Thioalkalivibrio thiocyanodenitrificans TaxID=243063 RepID=UPI00036A65F1|nr:hypothetical protein [Thioalkalivibrio thiocyanodenitrificans]
MEPIWPSEVFTGSVSDLAGELAPFGRFLDTLCKPEDTDQAFIRLVRGLISHAALIGIELDARAPLKSGDLSLPEGVAVAVFDAPSPGVEPGYPQAYRFYAKRFVLSVRQRGAAIPAVARAELGDDCLMCVFGGQLRDAGRWCVAPEVLFVSMGERGEARAVTRVTGLTGLARHLRHLDGCAGVKTGQALREMAYFEILRVLEALESPKASSWPRGLGHEGAERRWVH